MSKCGPDHIGNRTCKSERSVGAKDPRNDAAVDVARGFLADRALKPATVQRVLSSSEIPREGFAKLVSGETEKWAKVLRFDGIKPE